MAACLHKVVKSNDSKAGACGNGGSGVVYSMSPGWMAEAQRNCNVAIQPGAPRALDILPSRGRHDGHCRSLGMLSCSECTHSQYTAQLLTQQPADSDCIATSLLCIPTCRATVLGALFCLALDNDNENQNTLPCTCCALEQMPAVLQWCTPS